jgi:hypothetical protein
VLTWLRARVASVTAIAHGRYTLELPASDAPERLLQELTAHGVQIVSLNPIRTTLEDYFVTAVGAAAPRDLAGIRA